MGQQTTSPITTGLWPIWLSLTLLCACTMPERIPQSDQPADALARQIYDPTLYLSPDGGALFTPQHVERVIASRASPLIGQTLLGALVYLADTQVRDRAGIHSSLFDYCSPEQQSCREVILVNRLGGREYRQSTPDIKGFRIRNVIGEWANTIHFLPERLGDRQGETKVAIQDSTVFSTAGILYPLYFIDERSLPAGQRFISHTRSLAANSIRLYKRGDAYNFWIEMAGETSPYPKTGPFNVPVRVSEKLAGVLSGTLYRFWRRYTRSLDVGGEEWVRRVMDADENPYGFDAVFNIPNDADDTATVVAAQAYHQQFQKEDGIVPDLAALQILARYLDQARNTMDQRDRWRGTNGSGAFLTWLKDERLATFANPEQGIITHGVNNVDCVVNANAVFSLSLNDLHNLPGYAAAKRLLAHTAIDDLWLDTKCGLYYPQLMMFPYTVTRAYREGRLFDDPDLAPAMGHLLIQLLELQQEDGSFPGGRDKTRQLSTALAVSALLNIGARTAHEQGVLGVYQESVARGLAFLIATRKPHPLMFKDSLGPDTHAGQTGYGYKWDSGLYFSTSFWDLTHWRSEAYTAAIALEALVKFTIAYDMSPQTLADGRRLRVLSYGHASDAVGSAFHYTSGSPAVSPQ